MSGIFSNLLSRREAAPPASELSAPSLLLIPEELIDPNPNQPRRFFDSDALFSLADSIRKYGILQPLSVLPAEGGRYTLISGERRLRAARLAGLRSVPAIFVEMGPDRERRRSALAIIENIQRRDLNMFEEAAAIRTMICEFGMTQEEAAEGLSVSQSYVANKLRLLRLSEEESERILSAGLSERHARALLRLKSPEERRPVLERIIAGGLNVAKTEELIEGVLKEGRSAPTGKGRTVMVVKDVRLFCNSIDRAIDSIKRAGAAVTTTRRDEADRTEIVIAIHKG